MAEQEDDAAPAWLRPHGEPWRVLSGERVHDNPWFALDAFKAVAPTGKPADYYLQVYKNLAVGVLALHEDATVTLVGQWRFPFKAYSWELPEGGSPHGEAPLDGAKRELLEEAGLEAANWRLVLTMQLSNASSDEVALCYVATGLTPGPRAPDETEALAIARVPFREALDAAVAGRIQDSMTVAMLLRAHHMAVEGEFSEPLTRAMLKG
ncbi:MAG TPA: NUDIX hydrolase [Caulobacteraceae bacterium]|jgi:8-oxo-dGTP pyrophosphatase MutT (NUDIX family)|nr:NUDIX hydrolase [Caulobacteraceae bacterium]